MFKSSKYIKLYSNITLIVINVIYFIFIEIVASSQDTNAMLKFGAAYSPYILGKKEYYRLFTSIFMHFGIEHLANNMLILYLLGEKLEKILGSIKYLIIFILSGVLSNIISMYFNLGSNIVSAGASGAVFGIMGSLLACLVKKGGRINELSFNQIIIALGLSIYYGLSNTNIDNVAHIAGAVVGFVLTLVLYK